MLELKDKKSGVLMTKAYFRPYIKHANGTVITTQHKAWMDSVGMCMWADLVIGPWAAGRHKLLVWDNCGPHKVPAVVAVFAHWKIRVKPMLPNMTDLLQVGAESLRCGVLDHPHCVAATGDGPRRQWAAQVAHAPLSLHVPVQCNSP